MKDRLLALLLLLMSLPACAQPADDSELVFGVLPFMTTVTLFQRFAPLRDHLARATGRPVFMETAPDLERFDRRTRQRAYDLVLTAPHLVPAALDSGHYELVAKPARPLAAHIMVRNDNPARDLGDLSGRILAHAPADALIPALGRALFADIEPPPRFRSYPSHNGAYAALLEGDADAVIIGSYLVPKAVREDGLRELAHSDAYPGLALLVARDLPAELRARIRPALLDLSASDRGRALLRRIRMPGFVPARPEAFEPLRRFNPHRF